MLKRQPDFSEIELEPIEIEILKRVARGLKNIQIARQLSYSVDTIKWRLKVIYSMLDVGNRIEAVNRAREMGFLTESEAGMIPVRAVESEPPRQVAVNGTRTLPVTRQTRVPAPEVADADEGSEGRKQNRGATCCSAEDFRRGKQHFPISW